MGHDIFGVNKAGESVSYKRFSAGNFTSYDFYEFFDALEYHGGVSGIGATATYTLVDIELALKRFEEKYGTEMDTIDEDDFQSREIKDMFEFIMSCLETAREEGSVTIQYC